MFVVVSQTADECAVLSLAVSRIIDFGHIEILPQMIGGGSFSKVYRATYKGQPVAAKFFLRPVEGECTRFAPLCWCVL